MGKHKPVFRILIILPYLIALYILQSTVCPHLRLFGAKPLIIPLAAVGWALFGGRDEGAVMGLVMGILMDLSFNRAPILFTVTLTLVGLVSGYLIERVIVRGFPSYLAMSAAALLICALAETARPLLLGGQQFAPMAFMALRQLASSLLFAIPFYYLSRFMARLT